MSSGSTERPSRGPARTGLRRRLMRLDERVSPGIWARVAADREFSLGDHVRIGTMCTWGDFFFDRTGRLVEATHLNNGKKAWLVQLDGRVWNNRRVRIAERALVRLPSPQPVWPPDGRAL